MNLVFMGAPGAGKGTQSAALSEMLGIPMISTGDIFRENIKKGTELGKLADAYISRGELVPDDVTFSIVTKRLEQEDCQKGFILDGFPRTVVQAQNLDDYLFAKGKKIDWIVNLVVSEDEVIERLSTRRVCPICKANYNTSYNFPANGKCSKCNVDVIQREDDVKEVILNRLETYHQKTEPLINFYKGKGKLINVKSENDLEESFQNTLYALGMKKLK